MSRRRPTWLFGGVVSGGVVVSGVSVVVGGVVGVGGGVGVVVSVVVSGVGGAVSAVGGVGLWRTLVRAQRTGAFRPTRSSERPGGVGGLRVCRGGTRRGLLRTCTSVDGLVDYLLERAVDTLPAAARARFAEEWLDHRQHFSGWRLVWWALWVRATALRTATALGPAQLPRDR